MITAILISEINLNERKDKTKPLSLEESLQREKKCERKRDLYVPGAATLQLVNMSINCFEVDNWLISV